MPNAPAWNAPYAHNIWPLWNTMTMLGALREAGFYIRQEDYKFLTPRKKGSKNEGMGGLWINFRNRQHADNVRLALDGYEIGDAGEGVKLHCQRAGKDEQVSGPDPRPVIQSPYIHHIRDVVKRAYALKKAVPSGETPSQALQQHVADKEHDEAEAEAGVQAE